jgi:hypothetical protein
VTALAAGASLASQVEPGFLGFSVVAGIGVALFFLMRSMNKQLRKVYADKTYFTGSSGRPARPEVIEGTVVRNKSTDIPERTGADPQATPEYRDGAGQGS